MRTNTPVNVGCFFRGSSAIGYSHAYRVAHTSIRRVVAVGDLLNNGRTYVRWERMFNNKHGKTAGTMLLNTFLDWAIELVATPTTPTFETLESIHEDEGVVRDLVVQIAKSWPGHSGVNYETTSTENLLRLILDARTL